MSKRAIHVTEVPGSVPCGVIASLRPGWWRVVVGVDVKHFGGGVEHD